MSAEASGQFDVNGVRVMPVAGDKYLISTDRQPQVSISSERGTGLQWNLQGLQAPFARTQVYHEAGENRLLLHEEGRTVAYVQRQDALYITALQNFDPLLVGAELELTAYPAMLDHKSPMNYQDASSHYSRFIGYTTWSTIPSALWWPDVIAEDSLRIELEVFRDDVVDATGQLNLLYDTYDVARVYRNEVHMLHVYMQTDSGWVNQTDYFKARLSGVKWEEATYRYQFLTEDHPRPVAEVWTDESGHVDRVDYLSNGDFSKTLDPKESVRGLYVYPNPTFGDVRFEVFDMAPGDYSIEIYTVLGRRCWRQAITIEGGEVWSADLTDLSRGTYLYSLLDDAGKRLYTRRLVIISP